MQQEDHINLVSPEIHAIVQAMNKLTLQNPTVMCASPVIGSLRDYLAARAYVELCRQYTNALGTLCLVSVKHAEAFVLEALRYLNGSLSLVVLLRGDTCEKFRSESDEHKFEDAYFGSLYSMGEKNCTLGMTLWRKGQQERARECVAEVRRLKNVIAASPKYSRQYQELLEYVCLGCNVDPQLKSLFFPNEKVKPARKILPKVAQMRELSHNQKLSEAAGESSLFEASFDIRYGTATRDFVLRMMELQMRKGSNTNYEIDAHTLLRNYLDFEKDGLVFREEMRRVPEPIGDDPVEILTDLYNFFCDRFEIPGRPVVQFLGHVIFMFIFGNDLMGAALRTDVMRNLLERKGLLDKKFVFFRAKIQALCGYPGELLQMVQERRRKKLEEKERQHLVTVRRIECAVAGHQRIQADRRAKAECRVQEVSQVCDAPHHVHFTETAWEGESDSSEEIVMPRDKIKTRKSPCIVEDVAETSVVEVKSLERPRKSFYLPKKAFETFEKIRKNVWKFSRQKLCTLFEQLGCTVKIERGKGDHSRVFLPFDDMVIESDSQVISVLSEFRWEQSTLTLPNWDEKWDGRVPSYLAKSITKALDTIGAIEGNVFRK